MNRLFINVMLSLTQFELAIAEATSSNRNYIRRLRADEIHWATEQTKLTQA